jgi:diadenosine tetraphosphate (Ap4A) HIT family hydrolase
MGAPASGSCPFCQPRVEEALFFANERCLAVWPADGSGALIVPRAHRTSIFELTSEEWSATGELLSAARGRLEEREVPDGWNVGWNIGAVAGQHVDHVHCHLVPRYRDEPFAGRGIRYWLKREENRRPGAGSRPAAPRAG